MFTVTLVEVDDTVGNPDARAIRQYPLATMDTLRHALRVAREQEAKLAGTVRNSVDGAKREYVTLLVDRGHPYEYGNVYRTTYVLVGFGAECKCGADHE